MKVSREQAAQNRRRIVEVAGRLFRENGYDGIGVADIMKGAGLTHGGFYGHFGSKDELAAEASAAALESKAAFWNPPGSPSPESLRTFVAGYLSPEHRDNPGSGCALPALGADVAREPATVRHAFTDGVRGRIDALARLLPGRGKAAQRRKALATLAGVVGALTLARAVSDPELSDEILAAATEAFGT